MSRSITEPTHPHLEGLNKLAQELEAWARSPINGLTPHRVMDVDDFVERIREIIQALAALPGGGVDAQDAERYRWLRARHWNDSELFVVAGHHSNLRLGTYCPSEERLDAAIDAGMAITAPALEFSNPGDSEAQFIADGDHLNCPTCGGSGHVGDAR